MEGKFNPQFNKSGSKISEADKATDFKRGVLKEAHAKAVRYNSNSENRLYGVDLLKHNPPFTSQFIRNYNEEFRRFNNLLTGQLETHKLYANVQEVMDHEAIGKLKWLGESYDTLKLCALDDRSSSTDIMAVNRFHKENGDYKIRTALAIDVTYSEKQFQDKIENLKFYLEQFPQLIKSSLFFDEQTNTIGEKLVPRIALLDNRDNLDIRMANWINEQKGSEFIKNDTTQLKYLAQALYQSSLLSEFCDINTEAGKKLATLYDKNTELLKHELVAKITAFNRIPRVGSFLEILSDATEIPQNKIKSTVCKQNDTKSPLLHKLVWSM